MLDFSRGMRLPCAMPLAWCAVLLLSTLAHGTELSPADQTAVFKAAGFKEKGGKWIGCEEDPPMMSDVPGKIEVIHLNGDGRPEAWVTESSTFCYGNTGERVVLLTKSADGTWRKLLDQVGVATVLKTKHDGWPDIEVGGPGVDVKFPVFRWNGKTYAKK